MFNEKVVLVTGGTGSFGKAFIRRILTEYTPKKVIVFSRDEFKQSEMARDFAGFENIRFFIGDVRDKDRVKRAFSHVDYVIHAAALKQVPAMEDNPTEAVKTNVIGTMNVVEAAIDCGVEKVVFLSTDKAVNPINLYGATKLTAEKIITAANTYSGNKTKFCCVRYGNVMGSRGSVIPLFRNLAERGIHEFPITDLNMTRFWITLDEAVDLVVFAITHARGGEIFIPNIPSMKITDLARAIDPSCIFKETGIRPGEKVHECLFTNGDTNTIMVDNYHAGSYRATGTFTSDKNRMLTVEEMRRILDDLE